MKRLILIVVATLLGSGCVYYNGMYNARRLSDAAVKAEREGRTIDANSYWGQVTVKAETLLARHPDSEYAAEARALLGRAQAQLGNCAQARGSLETALPRLTESAQQGEMAFVLARCYAELQLHDLAVDAYRRAAADTTRRRSDAVRTGLVRSLRLSGRHAEVLEELASPAAIDSSLRGERMAALAGAGRIPAALALGDSLIVAGDSLAPWDSTAAALVRQDPDAASRFVDQVGLAPWEQKNRMARWLLDDARRLSNVDTARARARLEEVAALGDDLDQTSRARLILVRLSLAGARNTEDLVPIETALQAQIDASPPAPEAAGLQFVVQRVRHAGDSLDPTTPEGDLRLFLAAEAARDSLGAPYLAASLFQRLAAEWPESPYAPKALLAGQRLVPADSGLNLLADSRYTDSPYVAALRGENPEGLRALEDSLGAFAIAEAASRQQQVRDSRPPARDGQPVQPLPGPPSGRTTVEQ